MYVYIYIYVYILYGYVTYIIYIYIYIHLYADVVDQKPWSHARADAVCAAPCLTKKNIPRPNRAISNRKLVLAKTETHCSPKPKNTARPNSDA